MVQPINVPLNAVVTAQSLAAVRKAFASVATAYNVLPPPNVMRYGTSPSQMPQYNVHPPPSQAPPKSPEPSKSDRSSVLDLVRQYRLGASHVRSAPIEAPFLFAKQVGTIASQGLGSDAGMAAAGGAVGVAVGAAIMAFNKIKEIFSTLADYSAKSNPAAAKMLSEAFEDLQAVIGARFTPVIKFTTQVVRLVGDFLQTILPTEAQFEEVVAALAPVVAELRAALTDVAPLLQNIMVVALKTFAVVLRETVMATIQLVRLLAEAVKRITGYDALKNLVGTKPIGQLQSSFGAAAREATYVSNEEVGRRAVLNAFNRGFGVNWQEKTANAAEAINEKMDKLLDNSSGPGGNGGTDTKNWKGANDFGFIPPPVATSV